MKTDNEKPEIKLRPDAPIYIPLAKNPVECILEQYADLEPQCSRYSRKTVRRISDPVGPRPILGTKAPFPRPILGRKEDNTTSTDDEGIEEYIGKEFRAINRKMHRLKVDEVETGKNKRKNTCKPQKSGD